MENQLSGHEQSVQRELNPNARNASVSDPNMARDPVCGILVDMRTARDTLPAPVNDEGVGTLYFCSAECKALFEQDPQKYGYNL
jgi:YHS domain-containing protein